MDYPTRLIKIAFKIDQLLGVGKFVDCYYGPQNIPDKIFTPTAKEVLEEIVDLKSELSSRSCKIGEVDQIEYESFIRSFQAVVRRVIAPTPANMYRKDIEGCYGVPLLDKGTANCSDIGRKMSNNLIRLGYRGSLAEMTTAWRKENEISAAEFQKIFDAACGELCGCTFKALGPHLISGDQCEELHEKSTIETKLVNTNDKWMAYHYYNGRYRSVVEINQNQIFNRHDALILAAHECYPGHHFENCIKEYLYDNNSGSLLNTISLIGTPSSLKSEGLADAGTVLIGYRRDLNKEVAFLIDRLCMEVRHSYAIKMMAGEISRDEAINRCAQDAMISLPQADRSISFAEAWKYYFPIYVMGYHEVADRWDKWGSRLIKPLYQYSSVEAIDKIIQSV